MIQQLDTIILNDPTTRRDGDKIKKAGTYSPWLIKQFLRLEPEAIMVLHSLKRR